MNFLKLLIPKEKIVGIEINSQKLRMLYLELDSANNAVVKGRSEIDLDEGIIGSGKVRNMDMLCGSLIELKNNFSPKKFLSQFAIVTIPQNKVYSEIIEFPKVLDSRQLLETISTNAAEKLPLPLSSCYIDWEIIGSEGNKNQVLVSLIPKDVADDYISALKKSGFELIALETYFLSIERAIKLPESPVIFLYLTDEGMTSVIYFRGRSYLSQFEGWKESSGGKEIKNINDLKKILTNKIDKLALYFESKYDPLKISEVLVTSHGFNTEALIKKIGKVKFPIEKAEFKIGSLENSDWIPAAGAARRAFIPRSDDTIISLLPIGTESLYESQKAISFTKSILLFMSSLSLFYVAIFAGFYLFIASLENNLNNQLNLKNSIPISQDFTKIEAETKEFNGYISDIQRIQAESNLNDPKLLENITKLIIPGISFSDLNIANTSRSITVTGIASTRNIFKAFKNKMLNSTDFINIKISAPDIAKTSDIGFSITMNSK
ncbi:MAG: pilus assembly protein PilM [Minisyncoccia bacterium]